ncbi:MAG TPA: hypothetical protein PLD88_02290, partial [Candidatus Berkiella sp.]|nr:hypothetical protein [Candidatus Berkiella sp.]
QKQLRAKVTTERMAFPSFVHALQTIEQTIELDFSSQETKVNPRHVAFIENRLGRSIRQNNMEEAMSYILHGGKLTDRMVEQLQSNVGSELTKRLAPYIQEHELQKLEVGIRDLNLSKFNRQ